MPYRYAFISSGRSARSKSLARSAIMALTRRDNLRQRPIHFVSMNRVYPSLIDRRASYYDVSIKTFEEFSVARELGFQTVLMSTEGDWPILVPKRFVDHDFRLQGQFGLSQALEQLVKERELSARITPLPYPFDLELSLNERNLDYAKHYLKTLNAYDKC